MLFADGNCPLGTFQAPGGVCRTVASLLPAPSWWDRFSSFTLALLHWMVQGFGMWLLCFIAAVAWWLFRKGGRYPLRVVARRLLPVAVFYGFYCWLSSYTGHPSVTARAIGNGEGVVGVERFLHVNVESWFYGFNIRGAASFYDWAEILVTVAVVGYVVVCVDGRLWRLARNSLGVIAGVGCLTFLVLPVAPPRLLPLSYGFPHFGLGPLAGIADQVAAMPSLHTAFAGWVALILWCVLPGRWSWLGPVYVGLTAVVVLATGNHYVVDVVAGEALALGASRLPLTRVTCAYALHRHWTVRGAARCPVTEQAGYDLDAEIGRAVS